MANPKYKILVKNKKDQVFFRITRKYDSRIELQGSTRDFAEAFEKIKTFLVNRDEFKLP